ncbi:MAG TPA: methyltransferase domain-containing protein [Thermoanaerobaculia bacterium]|nr:methyltransferase domain-containing protein [Thermoanaerobaculia bacterium]
MSESVYIHGTAAEEQRRLSLLNDVLLNNASLREMALHGHERIIDFGSGLGQFTRAMARAVPRGHVVGIERNEEQLAGATRLAAAEDEAKLVEFRRGDVLNLELPRAEWGSFDVAHARFILEHVPDPLRVVQTMVRAVKPGGRIVLADDDHGVLRLWPEPPGINDLWNAYIRTYDRIGNDPYVGRRLVSLLHEGGAIPKRNTWIFFGGCAGMEIFPVLTANMAGVVRSAREAIISMSLFDAMAFDRVMEQYEEWSRRPDAAIWFSVSWAEGARP